MDWEVHRTSKLREKNKILYVTLLKYPILCISLLKGYDYGLKDIIDCWGCYLAVKTLEFRLYIQY